MELNHTYQPERRGVETTDLENLRDSLGILKRLLDDKYSDLLDRENAEYERMQLTKAIKEDRARTLAQLEKLNQVLA